MQCNYLGLAMTKLAIQNTNQSSKARAERMRNARIAAGLSQRQAAEKMGFGQSRVSNYENLINKVVPDDFLKLCAKTYDCSLEYLYGFSDELKGGYAYRPINKGSTIALNKDVLAEQGLELEDLQEITVTDNAMNNEFEKHSTIIISKKIGQISKPAIYAINQGGETVMRGLRKELSGGYTLFVHNKSDYDDMVMDSDPLKSLDIIGKYLGHWRAASN